MLTFYWLLSFYNSLPYHDSYRPTVSIMLQHIHQIPELSLEKLAALCFTSPTTINRLVRKLGCKSYTDFKRDIRDALSDIALDLSNMSNDGTAFFTASDASRQALFTSIQELANTLSVPLMDQVCTALRKSRKVSYYADIRDCEVSIYARHLQLQLVADGKETAFLWNPKDQAEDVKALGKDCLLLIPCAKYIPAYKNAISAIRQAHRQGAVVISIAEASDTLTELTDYQLEYSQQDACMDHFLVDWILTRLTTHYCQTREQN